MVWGVSASFSGRRSFSSREGVGSSFPWDCNVRMVMRGGNAWGMKHHTFCGNAWLRRPLRGGLVDAFVMPKRACSYLPTSL